MVAMWKFLVGGAVVGGAVLAATQLGGDDENKLPGGGGDGAEDEEGHLTPDKPPRPEPPLPPLDADAGWPSNVHILQTPAQFSTWAVVDVVEGNATPAARGTVYFGYSRDWQAWREELDALRDLSYKNDDVRFVVFDLADAKAATGHPEQPIAYIATSVGPEGQPREQAALFAKNMSAKNLPKARWMRLILWARSGPEAAPQDGQLGGGAPAPDAPPSSGNYGDDGEARYLPDHPRGPHWVVTVCKREQLPDGKVLRCQWYLFIGKHAGALSQANFSSTQYGRPWAGSLGSRAGAFAKAVDFIDDYATAGYDVNA